MKPSAPPVSDDLNDPVAARTADADWLSLALIDSRNHLLRWLTAFEDADRARTPPGPGLTPPLWLAGHAGWWAEHWIARNVQRQRGERGDPNQPRLASIDPPLAIAFDEHNRSRAEAGRLDLPEPSEVRAYLAESLEATLDLLRTAGPDDDALHFYRLALWHEDRLCEAMAVAAQEAGLATPLWRAQPARPDRDALWMPAQRVAAPLASRGLVPAAERGARAEVLPEFEIDAQAVSWARFVEFAEDGGYDEARWWTAEGWAWASAVQRRAPRHVERLRRGVLVNRQGRLQQAAARQAAVHVTRHEAIAWCQWAGRRLPAEPEWALAACTAASRGFVWGDVLEWVAGTAGRRGVLSPLPGEFDLPFQGAVIWRGASWMTPPRAAHVQARRYAAVLADGDFCGFRSCAL